ncbi:MAG: MBL fold metallo-hydrolase [Chromatiales bacterium]|nr:MBL fold metallo-hydrolase [Chromatiales bacterium]
MWVALTGTGYPRPHPERAGPGTLVRAGDVTLQFDAGRGTAMRLAALGVSCRDLDAVALTHHHSDHLVDLADLALSRWTVLDREGPDTALTVIAPEGAAGRFAARLLEPWAEDIAIRVRQTGRDTRPQVRCLTFEVGAQAAPVWSSGAVVLRAVRVHHEPVEPAVAYRVDAPDGAVVVSGDTRVCDEVEALARGARVLVHEVIRAAPMGATRSAGVVAYHADSVALGGLAARAGVEMLVLTHLIPAPAGVADEEAYVADVRAGGYRGQVVVGRDLDMVTLGAASDVSAPGRLFPLGAK